MSRQIFNKTGVSRDMLFTTDYKLNMNSVHDFIDRIYFKHCLNFRVENFTRYTARHAEYGLNLICENKPIKNSYQVRAVTTNYHTPDVYDFFHFSFCYFYLTAFLLVLWLVFFYLFSVNEGETVDPTLETRGFSRAQTGDFFTAIIPLTWSLSMIIHAGALSSNFDENTDNTLLTVNVIAYQWGWTYLIPVDADEKVDNQETTNQWFFKKQTPKIKKTELFFSQFLHDIHSSYTSSELSLKDEKTCSLNIGSCFLFYFNEFFNIRLGSYGKFIFGSFFEDLRNTNAFNNNDLELSILGKDSVNIKSIILKNWPLTQKMLPRTNIDIDNFFESRSEVYEVSISRDSFMDARLKLKGYEKYDNNYLEDHRYWLTAGITLPSSTPIHIICGSKDVIHSWAIPGLLIKIDCIPGFNCHRRVLLKWDGFYWGQCMEVCGRYHHWMPILIRVVDYSVFIDYYRSILSNNALICLGRLEF